MHYDKFNKIDYFLYCFPKVYCSINSPISNLVKSINASPTLLITEKASSLKASGKQIISLSAGEPDFDTPQYIKEAAILSMQRGETKYTAVGGTHELKCSIQEKFKRENELEYDLNQIFVGCGAKQVIFNTFFATLNADDEVLIPSPYWVSYPDMVKITGGMPKIVQCDASTDFKLTPEILGKNITSKTKWIIINSPNNPTGAVYSKEELLKIADVLMQFPNVYILSDDIYEHIRYNKENFYNIASCSRELKDRTIVVNGVSKAFSMTGWRIGYGAGPKEIVSAAVKIQSQSTSNACSISQAAASAALLDPKYQELLIHNRSIFKKRRDTVLNALNYIDGIKCDAAEGAFYLFPSFEGLIGRKMPNGNILNNSVEFSSFLLEEALVAVVPGVAFGLDGHFRISYAANQEDLEKGCIAIKNACSLLS